MRNRPNARTATRRELSAAQEAIDRQREDLIGKIEKPLKNTHGVKTLSVIRWRLR